MEWPFVGRGTDLNRALEVTGIGRGIAIVGAAGVGKSRLIQEILGAHEARGLTTLRAVASEATRTIPFAPFVDLLPPGPTPDRLELFRYVLDAVARRAGEGALVVSVDDAQYLDEGSLALLTHLVATNAAVLCFSVRTSGPMPSGLADLWTNGKVVRHDLAPLDRPTARAAVEAAIGPVDDDLEEELWSLAAGNVLVLHQMVEGAMGRALVRNETGHWSRTAPLTAAPRLSDLVKARLTRLPDDLRTALEVLAVGAPLPYDFFSSLVGTALDGLDGIGLIHITRTMSGTVVRPAHPLFGEILVAQLNESRRRAINHSLAQAAAGSTAVDSLRVAIWQLDSGDVLSERTASAAAAIALSRHDPGLAEQLARPAAELGDDRASLWLGRALFYQRRFQEAEEVFVSAKPSEPNLCGELASARAQNLAYGFGRIREAQTILQDAAQNVTDSELRARLDAERGLAAAMLGEFATALEAGNQVLANEAALPTTKTSAYLNLLVAYAMTGDCDAVDSIVEDALRSAATVRELLPLAVDQVQIMLVVSLATAGRIRESLALALQQATSTPDESPLAGTWKSTAFVPLDLAARHDDAMRLLEASLDSYRTSDPLRLEIQARGMLALARAQRGDAKAAESIAAIAPQPEPRLALWLERGRAWATAATGDLDRAAELAEAAGLASIAGQHPAWGALALHDAVRFGRPDRVVAALQGIDHTKGATLIAAMADHARALFETQPEKVMRVAHTFGEMGASLLAAEAAAQAACLFEDSGQRVLAAHAALCALLYQQRCDGAKTPPLVNLPRLVSAREAEIAVEAASGHSSAAIAESMFISVRTVDNHLRSVYRTLEIGGRDELARILEPVDS